MPVTHPGRTGIRHWAAEPAGPVGEALRWRGVHPPGTLWASDGALVAQSLRGPWEPDCRPTPVNQVPAGLHTVAGWVSRHPSEPPSDKPKATTHGNSMF